MFILNPKYIDGKNDLIDLKWFFKDKTISIEALEKLLIFLTKTSKSYSLFEAFNGITIDGSNVTLDFSKIDLSKCKDYTRAINNTNIKNFIFSSFKVDETISTGDKRQLFNLPTSNKELGNILIDSVEDMTDTNSIFDLNRGTTFREIYVNNSKIYRTSFYSNSGSDLAIKSLVIKNSDIYFNGYYGSICGTVDDTLEHIDISTSNFYPISFTGIFSSDSRKLKSIELGNIKSDTKYKFNNIQRGFQSCPYIEEIKFKEFDIRYLTNISGLFKWCRKLTNIVNLDLDLSTITEASEVFKECESLYSIPQCFNTFRDVKNLSSFFHTCKNIRYIQPKINVGRVNLWAYIYQCTRLEIADLSKIVIDKNKNTDIEKINFNENFKFCDNLTDIHLGLMKCGLVFQMQEFQNSPNIRRVFIPKETNMGEINTDGWVRTEGSNSYGIFKYCSDTLVIYTDANYSFSKDTQRYSGTKPDGWLEKFNFIANNTGLEIVGNTPYDSFFTSKELTFNDTYNKYILGYKEPELYIDASINGLEILEAYITNAKVTTTDQFEGIITSNAYSKIDYTDILSYYVNTQNKLVIKFKISKIKELYKDKGIILKDKINSDNFTYDCFMVIDRTDSEVIIPSTPPQDANDSNIGNIIAKPTEPNYGSTTSNAQDSTIEPNYGGSIKVDSDGNIYLVGNDNKMDFIGNYEAIKDYMERNSKTEELKTNLANCLYETIFNIIKNALANHELQYRVSSIIRSVKIDNLTFGISENKPTLYNNLSNETNGNINTEQAKKYIQALNKLLVKYQDLTSNDFKTLYNSTVLFTYNIDGVTNKTTSNKGLFLGYNYITGNTYRESINILKEHLRNEYSLEFWFI